MVYLKVTSTKSHVDLNDLKNMFSISIDYWEYLEFVELI
jgi:hypothetical protein